MTKRWFCSAAICFILGLLFSMKNLVWVLVFVPGLIFACFFVRMKNGLRFYAALVSCALLLSFIAGSLYGKSEVRYRKAYLDLLHEGMEVSVSGRLYKKEIKSSGIYLYLDQARILIEEKSLPCRDILVVVSEEDYILGNYLVLEGRYQKFTRARNEGNYDEEDYFYGRGVDIKIVSPRNIKTYGRSKTLRHELYLLRQKMQEVMDYSLEEKDAGVLGAMVTGDRTGMDVETRQLYSAAGISHVLSVSGLHVSLLCLGIYAFLRKLRLSLVPSAILSAVFSVSYCIFTGGSVATIRAVGMFLIMLVAVVTGESYDSLCALAFMSMVILVKNPMVLGTASFVMSFGAVLGVVVTGRKLILIYERITAEKKKRREYMRRLHQEENPGWYTKIIDRMAVAMEAVPQALLMNLGIMLTTIPMTAWFYYEIPVFSMLINLLIIPFMGLLLGLGFSGSLVGTFYFPVGYWTLQPCSPVLAFYEGVAKTVSQLSWATWTVGKPGIPGIILYYAVLMGVLVMGEKLCKPDILGRRSFTAVLLITSAILVLILGFSVSKPSRICMLDVDQGDGIFVRTTEGLNVFIDGGSTGVSAVGKYRILPFLKYSGIGSIDYWFVTHSDADHTSGLTELLESGYRVKRLVLSEYVVMNKNTKELILLAQNAGTEVLYMRTGDRLFDGTDSFEALMPDGKGTSEDANGQSLVLFYEKPGLDMLLTGDIGESEEQQLLKKWSWPLNDNTRILKVAHHGSKNSSCEEFLDMVGEKDYLSIISAGIGNSYGHPNAITLKRLETTGAEIYRTDKVGQITINGAEESVTIVGFRD